ncbi:MAG TPA: flagellar biosynthesis protein FlhF [Steroidobacteraceae bacterium]
MKIQRYIAKDMRSALAQVREALGADAVILSSGRIGDEVEVVAAMDFEAVQQVASQAVDARASRVAAPARNADALADERFTARGTLHQASGRARVDVRIDDEDDDGESLGARQARSAPHADRQPVRAERRASSQISEELAPAFAAAPPPPPANEAQAALASEMKDMRRLLEAQLATLTWNDYQRRSPVQAAMHKELAQLGMTNDLAHSLVRKIPGELNFSAARRFALATIARTVQVTGDRWLEKGGIVAFAGPAGAGKTTLLAKLAARWVMRHGPRRIAMISADSVRIGAHEQFHTLGRLLGVTTHNVFDVAELPELLYELRNCQFVMIDTAGTSPRDPELARQLHLLSQMQASIETSLVLPASTQTGAIEEVVQRFALARPSSCCITKIDEAMNLGGMLSALIRHKLSAAYVSDGQRVPEDLAPARAHQLVSKAVEIASHNGNTADDEVMQRRISGAKNGR